MYLSSELFRFRCSQSSHCSSLVCSRLLVLFLKGTRRWRDRDKTDVLWHTRISWSCISLSQTHTHSPLMQYINCTIIIQHKTQSLREVNVKSYPNWVRLSLFKMIEAWKDAAIKEIIFWITVIKSNMISVCWEFTFTAALLWSFWTENLILSRLSLKDMLDFFAVTIWSESYFPFGWEHF